MEKVTKSDMGGGGVVKKVISLSQCFSVYISLKIQFHLLSYLIGF